MDQNQTFELLIVIVIGLLALTQITLGLTILLLLRRVRSVIRKIDTTAEVVKATVSRTRLLPAVAHLGKAGFNAIKAKRKN